MIHDVFVLQNPWRSGEENFPFPPYSRKVEPFLLSQLENKYILGLVGTRQVGKSSLLFRLIRHLLRGNVLASNIFYFNLDDLKLHELFTEITELIDFVGKGKERKYIFIDEIQRLENPGLFLKELHDLRYPWKVIYSGSSQLEMKSKLKENLVGRARVVEIHRLSLEEIRDFSQPITKGDALTHALLYGSYPGVVLEKTNLEKKLALKDLFQSYVEKDIVDFLKVKKTQAFNHLLVLLATQTGSLLKIDNLSKALKISREEVEHYLSILENTFIIKRIFPFFRNYKKEITKTPKCYFLDNGLRNYLLSNFNSLEKRQDQGELFENFVFTELIHGDPFSWQKINYWRTTNQTEIDWVVQKEGALWALEAKWSSQKQPRAFQSFAEHYPESECRLIHQNNFDEIFKELFSEEK